jgi:glutaredoxin 3
MQQQLDVAQRFQPGAEAGLRPTDALRDRPDATSVECVEMEYAVRFAEPEGAQNDSLRLVGPPGHRAVKCRDRTGRESPAGFHRFGSGMARVQMYTTAWCGYCVRAKALLDGKGIEYEEINLDDDPHFRQKLLELTGGWTVPQILIDGKPIGGYTELWRLDKSGWLDEQLAAQFS